ncbi:MAG TPA: HD domain-containing protein [Bacteroidia bacterium]|nr:HD domain-containing protein [Bacteroidia bacterium]HNT83046.1 HD domain-containing protein [Bacteroidia bacterium]
MNKNKIINDPVYGFITIPTELIFDLIEHPFFQRLRRIKQLGLAPYVYPGAIHTRFHHALGAMHITMQAIDTLRSKGHDITAEEEEALCIAIVLHDIGHGPFSHALENSIVKNVPHEHISMLIMNVLNREFNGKLSMAIAIFRNEYPKKFLHQLISSQLDMDRLDYLTRDSFFTGVSEGVISIDRILKMLNVANDELVVDEKGIYSVEKFIVARRLMYWQVYLHKTVLAAENQLINILKRARELAQSGEDLFATHCFKNFLTHNYSEKDFVENPDLVSQFCRLDDYDIFASIKEWSDHSDPVLSHLAKGMVNRNLYKIKLRAQPFEESELKGFRDHLSSKYKISGELQKYFIFTGKIENSAYTTRQENINILYKNGEVKDIASASDNLSISALSEAVVKHYLSVDSYCFR